MTWIHLSSWKVANATLELLKMIRARSSTTLSEKHTVTSVVTVTRALLKLSNSPITRGTIKALPLSLMHIKQLTQRSRKPGDSRSTPKQPKQWQEYRLTTAKRITTHHQQPQVQLISKDLCNNCTPNLQPKLPRFNHHHHNHSNPPCSWHMSNKRCSATLSHQSRPIAKNNVFSVCVCVCVNVFP